jgi:hypothetical protein
MLTIGAMAQGASNPTVPQSNILYWTGTGSNRAVVSITWNDAVAGNLAIAWGVQWNGGNVLVRDIMDTIAAYDSRLTVTWNSSHSYINNIRYTDSNMGLDVEGVEDNGMAWWWYNWKDYRDTSKQSNGVMGDYVANGDFIDWMPMDPDTYESEVADYIFIAKDPNATVAEESSIDVSQIRYWVGEGSKKAILAVNWADTALAWGYRFEGSKSVSDMMSAIAAADPRFSFEMGSYGLDDIVFVAAPGDTLRKQAYSYWEGKNNGIIDAGMGQALADGDLEKWAEPAAGTVSDIMYIAEWEWWSISYTYTKAISPVNVPVPEEATIDASEILYWVGEGSKKAILAVNWADTALAWGYRFNGSKSVSDMMNDIATADPRFSIEMGSYGLDDIVFVVAPDDTLRKQAYSYWESKNNGVMDAGMVQPLADGDLEKWAEPAAGIVYDSTYWADYNYWSYSYAYQMEIHPVSAPHVGIAGADAVAISVFPNPTVSEMTLRGINENSVAVLYDMRGSVVATYTVGNNSRIDVSTVANGIYMLRVGNMSVKVIVRH